VTSAAMCHRPNSGHARGDPIMLPLSRQQPVHDISIVIGSQSARHCTKLALPCNVEMELQDQ
jgi:hypothetical protein